MKGNKTILIKRGQKKKRKYTIWWKYLVDSASQMSMKILCKALLKKSKSDRELKNLKHTKNLT